MSNISITRQSNLFWNFFQCQNKFDYWLLIYWIRSWITITLGPGIFIGWMVNNFHGLASVVIRDPYWYFFFKSSSMTDDILALAKFYLPDQYERMATEWHVNGKFTSTLLLFSRGIMFVVAVNRHQKSRY